MPTVLVSLAVVVGVSGPFLLRVTAHSGHTPAFAVIRTRGALGFGLERYGTTTV